MKFKLSNRKIEECVQGLTLAAKPHAQATTDGKTITRDFEIPPKARVLLMTATNRLQEKFEARQKIERNLNLALIPHGPANHAPEEVAAFQREFEAMLEEVHEIDLPQILLTSEKTERPDAIDLSKAPIPFKYLVDLFGIVFVDTSDAQPLKASVLSNRKIEECLVCLKKLSEPHIHTLSDGKTCHRDYDIPAKARKNLLWAMSTLKRHFDAKEKRRIGMILDLIPNGTENHSKEDIADFSLQLEALLETRITVELPSVMLYFEKTERADGIDLSKSPVPWDVMSPLLNVVLIESDAAQAESDAAPAPATDEATK